jgi:SsrA-binding protein
MPELAVNARVKFDYDILETFEAGIVLSGHEAKSAKQGHLNLAGGRALIRGGEAFLVGVSLAPFQPGNAPADYDPDRARKLLLTKRELLPLIGKLESGLTLVALRAYTHRGLVKISLGLARKRTKGDKREALKRREAGREIRRAVHSRDE